MRNYILVGCLIFITFCSRACTPKAMAGAKGTFFLSGKINSEFDSIKLTIWIREDSGDHWQKGIFVRIPIDKFGNFQYKNDSLKSSGRLVLTVKCSRGEDNYYDQINTIFELGDSINIAANTNDVLDLIDVRFSGRGAAKYECIQMLKNIQKETIFQQGDFTNTINVVDSIINKGDEILLNFRERITDYSYFVMRADIIGKNYNAALISKSVCGSIYDNGILSGKLSSSEISSKRGAYDALVRRMSNRITPSEFLAFSEPCLEFFYNKAKIELAFQHEGTIFEFKDLYHKICNDHEGIFRDRLIAYCFLGNSDMAIFFKGSDAGDYTNCLLNAVSLVKTSWLKQSLEHFLKARGKGYDAFKFILPADSSNYKIGLENFKGKVVLLDMWPYSCTGCYMFANAFHKRVFPVFKDDPDFKVISIYLDSAGGTREDSWRAYLRRLRGEGGVRYTFPEYINLFAGKGEIVGGHIERHYNIIGWPFILLIDKRGKIYSSTLPYFNDADDPNAEKLIELIRKAKRDL